MTTTKAGWLATTAIIGSLMAAGTALAQSTGTQEVDALVVTSAGGPRNLDGIVTAQNGPKSRSVVNQEYLATQGAGQTVIQSLNLIPGLNFTSNDPYGSSGGNIRLHGLDGAHIGLLIDGVPLNDAGNYAIYTNQQLDPELIEQANVNTGSADIDTATASSTGGVINYTTLKATADPSLLVTASGGSYDFKRIFGVVQTGSFGPIGTRIWLSGSLTGYDKFKGPGELKKAQVNGRLWQPIGSGGDFASVTVNYNRNRNGFFYNPNMHTATGFCDVARTQVCLDETATDPLGWKLDYVENYVVPSRGPGANTVPATNGATRGFFGLKINPSNTGTVRGSSRFTLADHLHLTVDPSYNFTLADGGGTTSVAETAGPLRGAANAAGVDINGDGDLLDTILVYSPSVTRTHRYGVNTSLIWDVSDDHHLRISYAYDQGKTAQTGEYSTVTDTGFPQNVFSAVREGSPGVLAADSKVVQKRNRYSIAKLSQFSLEYQGAFFEDKLRISAGVRLPYLSRDLTQYCYTPTTSTSSVYCTSETAAAQPNGVFRFASQGTTNYYAPYNQVRKYKDVLPSVGFTYAVANAVSVFANYNQQQSAPKVDNLYTLSATGTLGLVRPEVSTTFNGGLRYSSPTVVGSISAFHTDFKNRIVSTRSREDDTLIDRNVGNVRSQGVDAEIGAKPVEGLTVYASVSYLDAIVTNDIFVSTAAGTAPTNGKTLVETPNWTYGGRVAYEIGPFVFGAQAKHVGRRFLSDVNDVSVAGYTIVDADVRLKLPQIQMEDAYLQFNVTNLFDVNYYGSLAGTVTSATPGTAGYSRPFAAIGAPRALQLSLHALF